MKLDSWLRDHNRRRRAKQALWASIGLTVLLWVIPGGRLIGYPLTLFSTLVHELGHGLTALLLGGEFKQMVVFSDASGVATHSGLSHDPADGPNVAGALVSAGGLVGPAIVAGIAFAFARNAKLSRVGLAVGAVFLAVVDVLFMRNVFGVVFTALVAGGLGWLAWRRGPETAQIALVFLGIQMSLSVFSRADYLFTSEATTGAGVMPSDTAHMATALGGSFWMWGLACGAFSVLILALGVWLFSRSFNVER
ncbi:MAG: M50 family metallopeptidase [Myxococcota bacterium]